MKWFTELLKKKSEKQGQLLAKLLREAREKKKMTQTEAAAWVGRDQTFMVRIESGTQQATFVEVEQLAQFYRKPLSDFETIDQVENKDKNFDLALRPEKVKEYTEFLLEQRKERRKPKPRSRKPRVRSK